jgi:hypothetical protein
MDKETKRINAGILWVIGITLLVYSIYVYFVNPSRWFLASAVNVFFLVIGVILIALAMLIWRRY